MSQFPPAESQKQEENLILTPRLGRVRWTICAMLFVATSINYMDRQVIGLLKPTLQQSIGLTEVNYGYIIAAFQLAYAIGLIVAGRLVDRLGPRIGYPLFMGVWSLATMAHALARSALGFGVARFFLGLGEAGNFPAAIKTVANWFPQRERSLATGILNAGTNVGAILAPATVPWITIRYGWRTAFIITGLLGIPWMLWWFKKYRNPSEHPALTEVELQYICGSTDVHTGSQIPWFKLLGYRQTWAFAIAKFLTDPIWWFYLFWLPSFFHSRFNLDLSHLGLPLIIVYNVSVIGSIVGGWLPAAFRFSTNPARARLSAMFICACLVLPIFRAGRLNSEWAAVALLGLAVAAHQGWSANLFTIPSDMFPPSAVGAVVGIGGMVGSVGAVLFSVTVGKVLQLTHSYVTLFAIAASAYLIAIAVIYTLAPGLKKVEVTA
ncbi:MAG TPA: MFS transporter [Candidatus Acidoferrum sp.]|nr:MFS transporter [Candidatus Acidoferrum sp.]